MLVGSPSTHSAHKLQSRVSIDLTGDEAAAAPVALPSATDDEHLLISRVQLEALVAADRWEAAEALGGRVYELASARDGKRCVGGTSPFLRGAGRHTQL